ncbi:hypothetical protein OIDMADRAFT_119587 [Oidiodendron maius Zn]|uniref:Uncharacterized protein n=1 Tax=Oidiodendron maius (strain Zn) TaxID=913774 RepID=A0A0C3CVE4_OIDMZ|nr:hypothetical protein OIDMADRAFT_119587 [Oidiodendron maius Zn]
MPPNLECGQLKVPLDWSHSSGQQISLGMMKLKSAQTSTRIGNLIFNPGGPGGIATTFCQAQAEGVQVFSKATTDHFDIICPDPRGIGTSNPISCDSDLWNQWPSLFPKDEASFTKLIEHNKAFGQSCIDKSGDIVKFVDTTSVARDIEAIRIALGDDKLNWIGISYGTQIGAQYAELYPENIRAMVLDGNVDHSAPEIYATTAESETYENELDRFSEWCSRNETCALYGQDVGRIFDELVATADSSPISAPGCLPTADTKVAGTCQPHVTGEDVRFNVEGNSLLTYKLDTAFSLGWEKLGQALNESIHGNATLLSSGMAKDENSTSWQGLMVGCIDWDRSTTTFAQNEYRQMLANATAPHTRGASQSYQYNTQCINWPVAVQNPQHVLNQTAMRLAPPILMVNSNHDPESSYLWAQNMYTQIPSAVLVTRVGDGHSSYGLGGEATSIIDAYLINGTLPAKFFVVNS